MSDFKDSAFKATAIAVFIALAVAVVLLTLQNRRLKNAIETIAEIRQPEILPVGSEVPPLRLKSLAGDDRSLEFSDGDPTLLFFFRTDCPACQKTRPAWNRLAAKLQDRAEVLAVSSEPMETLRAYEGERSPSYPLFTVERSTLADYAITVVPQTLLVGREGLVLGVWPGELTPRDAAAIERIVGTAPRVSFDVGFDDGGR